MLARLFKPKTSRQKQLISYARQFWNVTPKNLQLYEQALRHRSVIGSGDFSHADCNERLELIGDSVLDVIITRWLYFNFPDANEGFLTQARAKIVNRKKLGELAIISNLDEMLDSTIVDQESIKKICGDAFEAWIGAIYLDRGFKVANKAVLHLIGQLDLDLDSILNSEKDYKSILIRHAQKSKSDIRFKTVPQNGKMFQCTLELNGQVIGEGLETSKKRAEFSASKIAYKSMKLSDE